MGVVYTEACNVILVHYYSWDCSILGKYLIVFPACLFQHIVVVRHGYWRQFYVGTLVSWDGGHQDGGIHIDSNSNPEFTENAPNKKQTAVCQTCLIASDTYSERGILTVWQSMHTWTRSFLKICKYVLFFSCVCLFRRLNSLVQKLMYAFVSHD